MYVYMFICLHMWIHVGPLKIELICFLLPIFSIFIYLKFITTFIYWYMCTHATAHMWKSEDTLWGVSSHKPCRPRNLNSEFQLWYQALLHTVPLITPLPDLLRNSLSLNSGLANSATVANSKLEGSSGLCFPRSRITSARHHSSFKKKKLFKMFILYV